MIRNTTLTAIGLMLISGGFAAADIIGTGQGLQFSQFDLTFPGAAQSNSAYGLAAVDFSQLTSSTGISKGYLNIHTSAGWVVQNMPVDAASGYPGAGTMFNLGNSPGSNVTSLNAFVDFSAAPSASFIPGATTSFGVGDLNYNAQGRVSTLTTPPASPTTPDIDWGGGAMQWVDQRFRESVEQDINQCGPGSFANSLTYLEDEFGITVPHDHTPGINGKDGNGDTDNSLVGEIDQLMNRAPHMPVVDEAFMTGKLDYIAGNGLGDDLIIKHWGGTFVSGNRQSTDGTVISRDETAGIALVDWIIQEIANGEDVELALGGSVMHWINVTSAGKTLGVPWISWTHDADQGYDDQGTPNVADDTTLLNGGINWWDGGVGWSPITDGELVFFLKGAELDFAVSESIPEPATLGLLALGGMAMLRKRKK